MEKENKKEDNNNIFWYIIIGICILYVIFLIIGFVAFAGRDDKVIEKEEHGGNIVLNYTSNVPGLTITEAVPTTDEVGMKSDIEGEYYDFSVSVSLDNATSVEYEISAIKNTLNSSINDDDIKIYLEREKSGSYGKVFGPSAFKGIKKESDLGSKKGSMVLTSVKKTKSMTDNYRLRMWLSDKSAVTSGNYGITIAVNGKAN